MRLFACVEPDAAARERIVAALGTPPPQLRRTDPRAWHVTLAFVASAAADTLPRLLDRLAGVAAAHRPVALRAGEAVMLGTALALTVDGALGPLAVATRDAFLDCGVGPDPRPFRAHLTVARLRAGRAAAPGWWPAASAAEWTAAELVLVRSRLGQTPRYEPVGRWPLGPAGEDGG